MNPNSKWFPESWSGRHSDRSISSKLNLWSRPSAMGGLVVFSVTADLFLFIVRAFSLFLNICYFGPITVFITCLFLMLCADGVLLLPNGVLSAEGVLSLPNGMLNPKISLQSSVSSATPVVIIHMITILISHHYLRRRLCWTPTTTSSTSTTTSSTSTTSSFLITTCDGVSVELQQRRRRRRSRRRKWRPVQPTCGPDQTRFISVNPTLVWKQLIKWWWRIFHRNKIYRLYIFSSAFISEATSNWYLCTCICICIYISCVSAFVTHLLEYFYALLDSNIELWEVE